jgi:hypothetical protein
MRHDVCNACLSWRNNSLRVCRVETPTRRRSATAQDVQELIPSAVVTGSDGYLAVDYARRALLLIEGMKEQQRTIEQLVAKVARLESRP